jgi:hypothetical protein
MATRPEHQIIPVRPDRGSQRGDRASRHRDDVPRPVAALVAQGKTEDEVVAPRSPPTSTRRFSSRHTGERFVRQAYADIKATR